MRREEEQASLRLLSYRRARKMRTTNLVKVGRPQFDDESSTVSGPRAKPDHI